MAYVIGIDGGGSKTLALLADERGRVLGRGQAGAANYQSVGFAAATGALSAAIERACASAGLPAGFIPRALCLGLAGAYRPEDKAALSAWCAERLPGAQVLIVNDAELLLQAGTPEAWGIAVIAGTGSIAHAASPRGETARAGGWGFILGDEGSGYALGLAALRAVLHDHDGRGRPTALTGAVLAFWGLPAPAGLVARIYRPPLPPAEIAALATLVEHAAGAGDEVAGEIVRRGGRDLAEMAAAVARRLDLSGSVPCALGGGLLLRGVHTREAFLSAAAREFGLRLDPVTLVEEPAQGAVRLALRSVTG